MKIYNPVDKLAIENIKDILIEQSGMKFENFRDAILEKRLYYRSEKLNFQSLSEYLLFLKKTLIENNRQEIEKLISELTVSETSFFRDPVQFKSLETQIFPELSKNSFISILSAGCATGEEPFSIAMSVYEFFGTEPKKYIDIVACDISSEALKQCNTIKYPVGCRRLQYVSPYLLNKYFIRKNGDYLLSDSLKKKVKFAHLNIINDAMPGYFDIIFCKNVMIYFPEDIRKKLMNKICSALKPGGFLFLGTTEILKETPKTLNKISFQRGVVFQKDKRDNIKKNQFLRHGDVPTLPDNRNVDTSRCRNSHNSNDTIVSQVNYTESTDCPKTSRDRTPCLSNHSGTLQCATTLPKKVTVKKLSGIIDEETDIISYNNFTKKINEILEFEGERVILDMQEVKFISYLALEKLVKAVQYIRKNNGDLVVVLQKESLRKLLTRINIHNIVTIFASMREAVDFFEGTLHAVKKKMT